MLTAAAVLAACAIGFSIPSAATASVTTTAAVTNQDSNPKLEKEVRHQLSMLPWYGVFDNLEFSVNGNEVTLAGQVLKPTTKDDAETAVKKIDGVGRVINNITVLPLSPMDNQIRQEVYRAIFSEPTLNRYSLGANPTIHIVVDNGNVTLTGYVEREADRSLAVMRAKSVPGVFSVTNSLRAE